jgi:hypothetical protein
LRRHSAASGERLVRGSNPSHPVDSGAATPVASRGLCAEGRRQSARADAAIARGADESGAFRHAPLDHRLSPARS